MRLKYWNKTNRFFLMFYTRRNLKGSSLRLEIFSGLFKKQSGRRKSLFFFFFLSLEYFK